MKKIELIDKTEKWISSQGYRIKEKDISRPWGAFWHIHPEDTSKFIKQFFPDRKIQQNQFISPKFLLVEQNKRLSLQLHHKRAECWYIINGPVEVVLGNKTQTYNTSDSLSIPILTPHRLIGLEKHGLVSEIWLHNDFTNPSDESDIERLEDDFKRY